MTNLSLHTTEMHAWVDRMRMGDRAAADELMRAVKARLERLARRMLRGYPTARRLADTQDVLQVALFRLVRSLKDVRPESTRSFFNLAAVHMRRQLLDLVRAVQIRPDLVNHPPAANGDSSGVGWEAAVPTPADADLDRWAALHEAVDALPADLRETFSLTFYHGWTQAQVAETLDVTDRQVRRRYKDACRRLHAALSENLPGL